jgi:hypothetical protein
MIQTQNLTIILVIFSTKKKKKKKKKKTHFYSYLTNIFINEKNVS